MVKKISPCYLASNSPRRWELLRQLGLEPLALKSDIDETPKANETAEAYCLRMALEKNAEAEKNRIAAGMPAYPILTADTTVSLHGQIFGKPRDTEHAERMLGQLSGQVHQVLTAVCVSVEQQLFYCVQNSDITFKKLTEPEIRAYIATGEPMDKAGAYAVQGLAGLFIENLNGSFTGVMGLPVYETAKLLKKCGVSILDISS